MGFVTGFPASRTLYGQSGKNILVVVDRLTKLRKFIGCNGMTAKEKAKLFIEFIFKHFGLPDSITFVRGPQFTAKFWNRLCKILKIDQQLSTAFLPQTDDQTEIVNAKMEQTRRCFEDYNQHDWALYLPVMEFAANNWDSETTQHSPFFAMYGHNPKALPVLEDANRLNPDITMIDERDVDQLVDQLREIQQNVQDEMRYAQAVYEDYANRHRDPAPNYQVGDMVYLDARNIKTNRPCKKLDWKMLGSFRVVEKVNSHAYRLELPRGMQIHNVFHAVRLRPAANNPFPGQEDDPSGTELHAFEEQEEPGERGKYFFERIDDYKVQDDRFLVKWKGFDNPTDRTWEPLENILHFRDAL